MRWPRKQRPSGRGTDRWTPTDRAPRALRSRTPRTLGHRALTRPPPSPPPAGPPPATWAGRLSSPEGESRPEEDEGSDEPEAEEREAAEPEAAEQEATAQEAGGQEPGEQEPSEEQAEDAAGEETVEADTPELADREAAREAALAGLRARTAEHAKRKTGEAPAVPKVTTPAPAPQQAAPAPGTPAAAPPTDGMGGPAEPEDDQTPPPRGLWSRFVAGSLLIVIAMTTATAVSLLVYFRDIARGPRRPRPRCRTQLVVPDPGKPQTILILGSDKRSKEQAIGARSDTTILLRVAADQISVLSIPRDLRVNIPGHGIDKFNAAYSYGGPKLTLKVVKQLTGLDNINHVVNVDFRGFADAVNSIDCVYVDVDHHYYHSNLGLAAAEQYAEIDIPAGYQRMCGLNALQYVRYRHDDNDLVRAARQQLFLREARQELPAGEADLRSRTR